MQHKTLQEEVSEDPLAKQYNIALQELKKLQCTIVERELLEAIKLKLDKGIGLLSLDKWRINSNKEIEKIDG